MVATSPERVRPSWRWPRWWGALRCRLTTGPLKGRVLISPGVNWWYATSIAPKTLSVLDRSFGVSGIPSPRPARAPLAASPLRPGEGPAPANPLLLLSLSRASYRGPGRDAPDLPAISPSDGMSMPAMPGYSETFGAHLLPFSKAVFLTSSGNDNSVCTAQWRRIPQMDHFRELLCE